MAEPPETLEENLHQHSHTIMTIQPTTKLGGRGTPRRKVRRSNNSNHTTAIAARTWESKLKPFRTQFQLQDQQELCDVTLLYEDGRIEMQKQVHVHSTWPMTIHEIDASEIGVQTAHINELDVMSKEYLCGNIFDQEHESNEKSSISTTATTGNSSNYHHNLQQRQLYAPTSRYYMNYMAYQKNPYVLNSYDHYSNSIQQIYGSMNPSSNEQSQAIEKPSKRRRKRRRKHPTNQTSEQSLSDVGPAIPQQEEEEDKPSMTNPENESTEKVKSKRRRQRVRKSKNSFPFLSSSSINTSDHDQSAIVLEHTQNHALLSSSIDQNKYDDMLLRLPTPSQHAEPSNDEQQQMTRESKQHVSENVAAAEVAMNGEMKTDIRANRPVSAISSILVSHIPTVAVIDSDQTEDENEKITRSSSDTTSINTPLLTNNESINQQQIQLSSCDQIQVNIVILSFSMSYSYIRKRMLI